ncbi:MAG: transglycosylase SLT domain-containing protein [Candidatus Moranbacteria bacterium]|jgi:hypothetical protein|nr:transglycosylase SLT domain-containing protein [Candidatus Moranbacteria bacterium]
MRNKKIKTIFIFLFLMFFVFGSRAVLADEVTELVDKYTYENFENIPGQERTNNFIVYLENLYRFGIAIVAILAIFMISFGSFVYVVTSAGNASKMTDAKDMIYSAIFGLILALVAFLVLYLINPDLVRGTLIQFTKAPLVKKEIAGQTVTTSVKYDGYNMACSEEKQADPDQAKQPIDFEKSSALEIGLKCNQYDYLFEKYGKTLNGSGYNGACILKVIAYMESSCRPNVESGANACGMMQLLPETAGKSCEELKRDIDGSVETAANYILSNLSKAVSAENDLAGIFAGYNSGYGAGINAKGKKGGLASSSDCPGSLAFECCINPGELDETIAYAWNGVGLYKYCLAQK